MGKAAVASWWVEWEAVIVILSALLILSLRCFLAVLPPPGPTWTNRHTGSCGTPRLPGECSWLCDHPLDPRWEGIVFSTMTQTQTQPQP